MTMNEVIVILTVLFCLMTLYACMAVAHDYDEDAERIRGEDREIIQDQRRTSDDGDSAE